MRVYTCVFCDNQSFVHSFDLQAMRRKCYSEASDVFSFGFVLYEMFARATPWEGHETLDVAFRVCSNERMPIPPTVLPAIAGIIQVGFDGESPREKSYHLTNIHSMRGTKTRCVDPRCHM